MEAASSVDDDRERYHPDDEDGDGIPILLSRTIGRTRTERSSMTMEGICKQFRVEFDSIKHWIKTKVQALGRLEATELVTQADDRLLTTWHLLRNGEHNCARSGNVDPIASDPNLSKSLKWCIESGGWPAAPELPSRSGDDELHFICRTSCLSFLFNGAHSD
jgi:hypothetical protein